MKDLLVAALVYGLGLATTILLIYHLGWLGLIFLIILILTRNYN